MPLQRAVADVSTHVPPATAVATNTASVPTTWVTFGLDRIAFLHVSVMGNPLWQYLAAFIYIVLAFAASKLLDYVIQVQLRKVAAKTKTPLGDLLIDLARGPVMIVAFVILLYAGLQMFAWPDWARSFLSNALKVVVACALTYVALKFVDLVMGLWQKRVSASGDAVLDMELLPVIRKSLKVFIVTVAALVTSQNLGLNVTGLIASLSIGGLAVGLAAQDTLSNVFGAVALFADKPFRVGDRIQIKDIDGTVEAIGMRSTRIRHLDGYVVTVPNRTMASEYITNVSKRPNIKTVMNIGVTYDTPCDKIERAMKIIDEVYRPHPKTSDLIISFNKFESTSLNLLVVHWWESQDYKEYLLGFQHLNLELKKRFDAEGINFAFPTQTVYLKQDSEWSLAGTGAGTDKRNRDPS
jgi:MscS family membrane protein